MKRMLFIVCGLALALQAAAQDCANYLYMQKNKTIEMTGYNNKGDVTMKSVATVSDVTTVGDTVKATVASQVFDKNGKQVSGSTMDYKCSGGAVTVQMHVDAGQSSGPPSSMNFSMTNSSAGNFPAQMNVGDHLPDYTSQMAMGNGMKATVTVTDRIVAAKESVTTPAGTWDCYKITYKSTTTTGMGRIAIKMPGSSNESTVWIAPGVGMVKSESKYGSMVLTAIR